MASGVNNNNTTTMFGSEISQYFKGKSIFLTGGTGFIGKCLIEKLLRSCYDLKTIYVLVRPKKGHSPRHRLNELLHCKLFETLSQHYPEFRSKLVALQGDLLEPNLGLSKEDEQLLIDNCNIVFHSAATVRFDEPLKLAVEMNIIGVKKMISLAKKIKNLECFEHVSTAYANCDREHVSEVVYNPPVQPDKILEAVDWMQDDLVHLLTPKIIALRPNTYTFTKAVAENLIMQVENDIPCTIVRPSIVGASWQEPFKGWIDGFNGPTAIFIGVAKGVMHVMKGNRNAIADIIPVDTVCNLMIAAAWFKGAKKTQKTIVYNCTSGQINPLKWSAIEKHFIPICTRWPYDTVFLYPYAVMTSSNIVKNLRVWAFQMLPAYIIDFYLKLTHQKPIHVRIQDKVKKAFESLEYFTSHQWEFTNDNLFMLRNQLNETDAKLFNFDIKTLNWISYIEQYYLGTKQYLLKDDMNGIDRARAKIKRVKRVINVVKAVIGFLLVKYLFFKHYSFKQLIQLVFGILMRFVNFLLSYLRIFKV